MGDRLGRGSGAVNSCWLPATRAPYCRSEESPGMRKPKKHATHETEATDVSHPSHPSPEGFIPPHGGYKKLFSYPKTQIIYDATVRFCDRFISSRSRTHDQM